MKNKKGKKLVVLGAMAALLTLIGVSGSQTYAKYVESKEVPTQSATVAKWGMIVSANANDLFANDYIKGTGNVAVSRPTGNTSNSIIKGASELVAPGASGSITFGVRGSAEVASRLTFTIPDDAEPGAWEQVELFDTTPEVVYTPIKWTLRNTLDSTVGTGGVLVDGGNFSDVVAKLEARSNYIAPGTEVKEMYELSYVWDFQATDNPATTTINEAELYNEYDTVLGHLQNVDSLSQSTLATKYSGYTANLDMSFEIKISIEQVQA